MDTKYSQTYILRGLLYYGLGEIKQAQVDFLRAANYATGNDPTGNQMFAVCCHSLVPPRITFSGLTTAGAVHSSFAVLRQSVGSES
jgi:hypothetical protein